MDTDVPRTLMEPLFQIVDKHTTRNVYTDRGTFRVEVGYFLGMEGVLDDDHNPIPTPAPDEWDRALSNHPFLDHLHPPKRAIISKGDIPWKITLYGAMQTHPFYYRGKWELGVDSGKWELRADVTLDPETCDATVERMVAGPDEIALYPEDGT